MMHEQVYKELVTTQAPLDVVDNKEGKTVEVKCLKEVPEPEQAVT